MAVRAVLAEKVQTAHLLCKCGSYSLVVRQGPTARVTHFSKTR